MEGAPSGGRWPVNRRKGSLPHLFFPKVQVKNLFKVSENLAISLKYPNSFSLPHETQPNDISRLVYKLDARTALCSILLEPQTKISD